MIRNTPSPAMPHFSTPLYVVPGISTATGTASLTLSVYRGSELLTNPYIYDLSNGGRINYPNQAIYQFSIKNEEAEVCTITGFTITGYIELYISEFAVGATLATGEERNFWIKTSSNHPFGDNELSGEIVITNDFTTQPVDETHSITIIYNTLRAYDSGQGFKINPPTEIERDRKLHPDTYIREFSSDGNTNDIGPVHPGTDAKS